LHSTFRSRHISGRAPQIGKRARIAQVGPSDQEERIQSLADSARNYLTALNSGGVGLSFAVAGALAPDGVELRWVFWPVLLFVLGLLATAGSHIVRRLDLVRRRQEARGQTIPLLQSLPNCFWSNFTYELFALGFFVAAVSSSLWELCQIELPDKPPLPPPG
jgi:hypothetical protein